MAAAKMAAARSAASRGAAFNIVLKDANAGELGISPFRLRDSSEAIAKAKLRFSEADMLVDEGMSFEDEVQLFLNTEPEECGSFRWYQWAMATATESFIGRFTVMFLVIVNGIIIGVEADWGHSNPEFFKAAEMFFVWIFVLEGSMKLFAFQMDYFKDAWNVADFVIIIGSLIQLVIDETTNSANRTPGLSALRLVKVLRVVRLVGMLKRLATLAAAFIEAMKQVAWVMVLFFVVLYIFSVMAQNLFGLNKDLVENNKDLLLPRYNGTCEPGALWHGDQAYGPLTYSCYDVNFFQTVPKSALSLFQVMTFDDWAPMMRPVLQVAPWQGFLFICFFCPIAALGLMNLITAVFIEALMDCTRDGRLAEDEEIRKTQEVKMAVCLDTLREFDQNGDGKLQRSELSHVVEALCSDPEVEHAFEEVGVPLSQMKDLIKMCETESDGVTIKLEQLLTMTMTKDLATLRHFIFELKYRVYTQEVLETKQISLIAETMEHICAKVEDIEKKMAQIEGR